MRLLDRVKGCRDQDVKPISVYKRFLFYDPPSLILRRDRFRGALVNCGGIPVNALDRNFAVLKLYSARNFWIAVEN